MADDDSLRQLANRIQARAVSRMGELLKQFNHGQGRPKDENRGSGTPISQAEAGRKAGLSPDQIKQAVRVANVPEDVFESLVESDNPPTVTALAEMGKQPAKSAAMDAKDQEYQEWLRQQTVQKEEDKEKVAAFVVAARQARRLAKYAGPVDKIIHTEAAKTAQAWQILLHELAATLRNAPREFTEQKKAEHADKPKAESSSTTAPDMPDIPACLDRRTAEAAG
jgi:hypothetical protein